MTKYYMNDYQGALEDFNTAIRLKPDEFLGYYKRGNIYYDLEQYKYAIENYDEAIRLKPDLGHAYNKRGSAYLKSGDIRLGCSDAQKACELGNCKVLEWAKVLGYCPLI